MVAVKMGKDSLEFRGKDDIHSSPDRGCQNSHWLTTLIYSHLFRFSSMMISSMRPVNLVAVNLTSLLEVAKLCSSQWLGMIDCPIFLPYRKFSVQSNGGTCRPDQCEVA